LLHAQDPLGLALLRSIGILVGVWICGSAIWGPKVRSIWRGKENMLRSKAGGHNYLVRSASRELRSIDVR